MIHSLPRFCVRNIPSRTGLAPLIFGMFLFFAGRCEEGCLGAEAQPAEQIQSDAPVSAPLLTDPTLRGNADELRLSGKVLEYEFSTALPAAGELVFPRWNGRLKAVYWKSHPEQSLILIPEPQTWRVKLTHPPSEKWIVVVELLDPAVPHVPTKSLLLGHSKEPLELPAHFAVTHGEKLRFEPQPHKNTLGYWTNPQDWAYWTLNCQSGGTYEVEILQGCGNGQGGSTVNIVLTQDGKPIDQLLMIVEETGHFQNFKSRRIGTLTFPKTGAFQLEIRPQKLAKNAVMDVRKIILTPVIPPQAPQPK